MNNNFLSAAQHNKNAGKIHFRFQPYTLETISMRFQNNLQRCNYINFDKYKTFFLKQYKIENHYCCSSSDRLFALFRKHTKIDKERCRLALFFFLRFSINNDNNKIHIRHECNVHNNITFMLRIVCKTFRYFGYCLTHKRFLQNSICI